MKPLYFLFLPIISAISLYSQDINFSQFYELPLLRNPALAGNYEGDLRLTSGIRNQWSSVTTPYKTMALGGETKFNIGKSDNYIAVGLQLTHDVAGDAQLSRTQALPVLAFHKTLSKERNTYLSLGLMGGAVQQRFDLSDLRFGDQFVNGAFNTTNPTRQNFTTTNKIYWDAAAGLVFSSTAGTDIRYYIGASLSHFTQPNVAFASKEGIYLLRKQAVTAGFQVPLSDAGKVLVFGDYFLQGGNTLIQLGGLYKYDFVQWADKQAIGVSVGSFLRMNDAVIPVVRFDFNKLGIGITYDVNVSKLKPASQLRGGIEFMLSYKSFLNMHSSSADKGRCPRF